MKLLQNCRLIKDNSTQQKDILIEADTIVKIADKIEADKNWQIIDMVEQFVLPGFIDFNVHLGEDIYGNPTADSYEIGSKVALKNGITTIFSHVIPKKDESLKQALARNIEQTKMGIWCDIGFHLTPKVFDDFAYAEISELIQDGFSSYKLYTNSAEADLCCHYHQIEEFAKKFVSQKITILTHCEDNHLIQMKARRMDSSNLSNLIKLYSKTAEITAVKKILRIARNTGAQFHIVNATTYEVLEEINRLKYNIFVTCEISPHYLLLDNSSYQSSDKAQYITAPPLRDSLNNKKVLNLFKLNYINLVTSQHCAYTLAQKNKNKDNFQLIPPGLVGLDYLPCLLTSIYNKDFDKANILQQKLAVEPARLSGLYPDKGVIQEGAIADIVAVNFDSEHPITGRLDLFNPYQGVYSTTNIDKVIKSGELLVDEGKMLSSKAIGIVL